MTFAEMFAAAPGPKLAVNLDPDPRDDPGEEACRQALQGILERNPLLELIAFAVDDDGGVGLACAVRDKGFTSVPLGSQEFDDAHMNYLEYWGARCWQEISITGKGN